MIAFCILQIPTANCICDSHITTASGDFAIGDWPESPRRRPASAWAGRFGSSVCCRVSLRLACPETSSFLPADREWVRRSPGPGLPEPGVPAWNPHTAEPACLFAGRESLPRIPKCRFGIISGDPLRSWLRTGQSWRRANAPIPIAHQRGARHVMQTVHSVHCSSSGASRLVEETHIMSLTSYDPHQWQT
jgi:hypothetical protein